MRDREEPAGEEARAGEARLLAGLSALKQVTPPPSLVPAVMQRIAEPPPRTFWSWLWRSRRFQVRLSPLGAFAGMTATVAAVCGLMLSRPALRPAVEALPEPVAAARPSADGVVLVRFVLVAKGAKKVAVAGDFNGWSAEGTALENADGQGTFVATVPLPRGSHEYMFLVDGAWVTDPAAPETRPDGFGRSNAVLRL
jgi:hypothetical protein